MNQQKYMQQQKNSSVTSTSMSSFVSSVVSSSSSLPVAPPELQPYLGKEGTSVLRINKQFSSSACGYSIGRFPPHANLYDLSCPVCLHRDVIEFASNISEEQRESMIAMYDLESKSKWRIKNDPENENKKKINFVARKEEIETDHFFILIQTNEGVELFPVSSWLTFELDLNAKAKHCIDTDEAERHNRVAEANDAAMNEKLRKRLGEGENRSDDEKLKNDEKKKSKNIYETSEAFAEDLGLKRQEKKMMRNLMKSKHNNKANEYVNSALALTTLRENEVTWDFEEGERSDDEEIANDLNDNNDNINEVLTHELQQDDDVDGNLDEEAPNLTTYGQNVRNLLKKQQEKEQEDELNQYDSGDDDDEENAENSADNSESTSVVANNQNKLDKNSRALSLSNNASSFLTSTISTTSNVTQILSKEEMEQKVIRILSLHMGRMNVKDFMSSFKVKDKNDEFKLLQCTIQRLCCISAEEQNGQKIKFVNLKPEYRR